MMGEITRTSSPVRPPTAEPNARPPFLRDEKEWRRVAFGRFLGCRGFAGCEGLTGIARFKVQIVGSSAGDVFQGSHCCIMDTLTLRSLKP